MGEPSTSPACAASHLDAAQVEKAAAALLKHMRGRAERSNNLLEEDDFVYLVIALKQVPPPARRDKPVRVPLPHPIYAASSGAEVCLFVKDAAKGGDLRDAKRRGAAAGAAKVVGLSRLRGKYESHEARRRLAASYDLFVADDRVLPSLARALGKPFFSRRRQPVPARLAGRRDWGPALARARVATYLPPPRGSCVSVRVARASQAPAEAAANAAAAAAAAAARVPGGWAAVRAAYLKGPDTAALPVYAARAAA